MGSRRNMTRSSFGNGRSGNGDDISGSSRPGGCSYLSNVRPENRSTLCSMMAQLTEETQPSFEKTLKSKAVSENCNVKFFCVVTGHPTPQLIWYKDDVQLDRYCGLPKYEIFRNGLNHSLHIYNCTLDDAAIYQASASNSKGIVSCSGVLEVGEMNEFKIHQRYFSKLKQKADNRHREAEGKENQEPLRTISPDRTQRKRRSTMEAFLSTPSSIEDESNEEGHHAVSVETEARLQEASAEEVEEKPAPITNGAVSTVTNGQAVSETGTKSGTYIYDSAQKIFTAHQPKTPFVKKKIKISNSAKVAKSDTPGERREASEERRAKDETSASVAVACTESMQSEQRSEEVMEVENIVSSSPVVDSNSRNVTEHEKSERAEVLLVERPSKGENICVEATVPSQKEQLTASVPSAALTSTGHTVSRTEGKQSAKREKNVGRTATEVHVKMQKQPPPITSTQIQTSVGAASQQLASTAEENFSITEVVTVMEVEEMPKTPSGASKNTPCESRTALPSGTQAGDQLSEKETSPCQINVSASQPALLSEVTQAHTTMNRNGAPVNIEPPLNQCLIDAQLPQKTPSETHNIQTPSFNRGVRAAIDKMTQDTWGHSKGLNESHKALFTDSLQSPAGGENTASYNVSSSAQKRQVDTAIKTAEGTKIQAGEKAEHKGEGLAPNEKIVEMETESAAPRMIEHTETEKTENAADVVAVAASNKGSEKNEHSSKMAKEASSELHHLKSEPASPPPRKTPENAKLQIKDVQEIPKPVTKVISVAELLRSQIKALDSALAGSLSTILAQADSMSASKETSKGGNVSESKCDLEVKKSLPDRKSDAPIRNIKDTLMEVYNQLYKTDQEQIQTQAATPPPVQALQKPPVVPPISVVGIGTTIATAGGEETGTSTLVSNLSGKVSQESGTLLTVTPAKTSDRESNTAASNEPVQDKLKNKATRGTTGTLPDQHKKEGDNAKNNSLAKLPNKIELGKDIQEDSPQLVQQDSSMTENFSRTVSQASAPPEASPLLKKRNVSPIPSATAQELASGARRKILMPKAKPEDASEVTALVDTQPQTKEVSTQSSKLSTSPVTLSPSPSLSRSSPLLQPPGEQIASVERRSPLASRRKTTSETQATNQQPTEETHTSKTEGKSAETNKHDPFKAPQVIRKIRAETFADASGHLKLWCQFFNVLSDSTIKWYRNEEEIAQIKRQTGDETQVNLAIVQASCKDSGVYGCTITNEYGTDSTDCLLSTEMLAGMSLREDLGAGEEIEMTPMLFNKGVADSGAWGNKFFGRIMMQESHIGDGCSHKVWRAKVIYGLEPVFESGNTCIIKACNPIAYGGKGESCLIDRNLDIVKQECKFQNLAREYCKIFSAEARVIENFGNPLEVIPVYLMYRPANTVPYATVEADLTGVYQKYSALDHTGRIEMRTGSEVEQKCCALQHWLYQWTSGNMLLTRIEGVDTKITNIGIAVKSTGHQGLSIEENPKVFEQFVSQHQCNYFCGLLSLRSLKIMDSLLVPAKPKGSRSPLLQRKMAAGSSSPQTGRKAAGSPRLPRKTEQDGRKTPTKEKSC